jgi:16S rRNA C967 or C1407 C5-methylase (RsmB/RsmF family)
MEVNSDQDEDDDVIVTKVKMAPNGRQRQEVNKMEGLHENPQNEMPALQLDAYGKPINYKEILLHYISQKLKNDSKNTCLENINSVAERPRRNMSMEELCKKLKDTRDKLEQEQLKWKRKLLSSLEVVLIKKIRRLEKDTHDVVPEGIVLEGVVNGKREEGMSKEGASIKGSNNDIVAMMEDLTSEGGTVQNIRCKQRTERNSHSVSIIRGYDSS